MSVALLLGVGTLLLARPRLGPVPLRAIVSLGVLGLIGLVGHVIVDHVASIGFVVLASAVALATYRALRVRRRRAVAAQRAGAVQETCEGLAADLSAGLSSRSALDSAADRWLEFRPVAHAAHLGADVPGAMRAVAALPGAEALHQVAAAWTVAHRSGAGLADAMSLAAANLREGRAVQRTVTIELSSALATARLLAVLPLPVLLIGRGVGGDPFAYLFGTSSGQICLCFGLGLSWLGTIWLDRIADGVRDG